MSDTQLHPRQALLLSNLQLHTAYAAEDLARLFDAPPAPATIRRDMQILESLGFVLKTGERRGTRYTKTILGALESPINARTYFKKAIDIREGLSGYQHGLWDALPKTFFSDTEQKKFNDETRAYTERSVRASAIVREKELERFVIELSWKSSKIEGNTYTLLDTERLIRDGAEASGHTKEEAIMIVNHKKAFQYVLDAPRERQVIDKRFVQDVHRLLVQDLGVSNDFRRDGVGITGSLYKPLAISTQIEEELTRACTITQHMDDPYSQALSMLVGISYLQPFEDGNKRTARLMANAVLFAHDCAPLSYRNVDEVLYRESMLTFYEQISIVPMRQLFAEQYSFACAEYLKG